VSSSVLCKHKCFQLTPKKTELDKCASVCLDVMLYKTVVLNCCVVRKVLTESSTGSSSSNKVRTMLSIQVETIDFDTQACVLRVKGRNVQENEYVKVCIIKGCL